MNPLIEVKDITKKYVISKKTVVDGVKKSKHIIDALQGITFSINEGETIGIVGESGCGKSTLGRILVGLDKPTSGTVHYNNKSADELLKENRLGFHRMCQMVFQNPFDTFDSRYTIERILLEPLKLHKIGASDKERLELIVTALEEGGLVPASQYLTRLPHELSGGQLQRVSIIRAMLLKPQFLVADEPVSMLDVSVRKDIIRMLKELTAKEKTTLIFISHDIATTREISDRVIVMYFGNIVEEGKSKDVLTNPNHEYTKLLISSVESIDPREGRRYKRRMSHAQSTETIR